MAQPRTIQIFLPSGDPRGIRWAELTTSIVRIIEVPRKLLPDFFAMPESKQVGVYFLIGDEDEDAPEVYIGQTGDLTERLTYHHKTKDFWNRALVVVSLTNNLTQTHALYLEWLSIRSATEAKRYAVQNGNGGSKPHTPAPLEADCVEVFGIARTLLATLGQPVFEPLAKPAVGKAQPELFYCKGPSYDATAQYTEEGMVVLAGSKGRKQLAPSISQGSAAKRRAALLADGSLAEDGEFVVFKKDVLFKTPSGAGDAVTAASVNGWAVWKTKDGKTLDELKRAPLVSEKPSS